MNDPTPGSRALAPILATRTIRVLPPPYLRIPDPLPPVVTLRQWRELNRALVVDDQYRQLLRRPGTGGRGGRIHVEAHPRPGRSSADLDALAAAWTLRFLPYAVWPADIDAAMRQYVHDGLAGQFGPGSIGEAFDAAFVATGHLPDHDLSYRDTVELVELLCHDAYHYVDSVVHVRPTKRRNRYRLELEHYTGKSYPITCPAPPHHTHAAWPCAVHPAEP